MTQDSMTVGIDVSRDTLDIRFHPAGEDRRVDYDGDHLLELVDDLVNRSPTVIVVEATGALELSLTAALAAAGLAVAVINPRQGRDFARSIGRLAKTDRLDARVLAEYGAAVNPEPRPLPDGEQRELRELVNHRQHLIDVRTAQANRRSRTTSAVVRDGLQDRIEWLTQQAQQAERAIKTLISDHPCLKTPITAPAKRARCRPSGLRFPHRPPP